MAKGINKVILIGNIGADPEVKYMPSGGAVVTLSLATTESWRDKQSGDKQERTEWHRIVFFNRLAEIARDYLKKGAKLYVEGSLRTRKWQDKTGQERYTTEIVGNDFQMLDAKQGGAPFEGGHDSFNQSQSTDPFQNAEPAYSSGTASQSTATNKTVDAGFDDDIPF